MKDLEQEEIQATALYLGLLSGRLLRPEAQRWFISRGVSASEFRHACDALMLLAKAFYPPPKS
jgi:hypothetical protein